MPKQKRRTTLTITEFARMGAKAQRKKYGVAQLRAWGKLGGRPRKTKSEKGE